MKFSLRKAMLKLFILVAFCSLGYSQNKLEDGIASFRKGEYQTSITEIKSYLKDDPKSAEALYFLGKSYLRLNKLRDSENYFRQSQKLKPLDFKHNLGLAYVLDLQNKPSLAYTFAIEAVRIFSGNAVAFSVLSSSQFRRERFEQALDFANKSSELDRTYARAYLLKTQIKLAKLLIDKQSENLQAREKLFSEAVADFNLYLKYSQLEKEDYRILQKASLDFFRLYFLEKKVKTNNFKSGLQILKQPKPIYPKTEKANGVSGVVKLLVEFRADGKVGNVFVLNGINKDLDENAIAAAKSIVFKPNVSENMNVTEVRLLDFAFGVKK